MRSVSLAWQILRHMGPGWCAYRAYYAVARRSGALARRIPATAWEAAPLPRLLKDESLAEPEQYLDYRRSPAAPAFLFKAADRQRYQPLLAGFDDGGANPIDEAEAILDGRLRFFSCHRLDVGFPPDWHRNHLTGQRAPTASHWSRISATGYGDIKCIWELSRFAWAYTLVRAYWRTGDERYPEAFWRLFEDWRAHNPPNTGPNWMCGQEVALRLMASCFALYGLLDSCTTTPERVALLGQFAAVSAHRVRAHIGYALSQRNNHGISEAMGLWTAGLLFPEFSQAAPWRRLGGRLLEREALRLIYDDGSCSQHSVIYQRLMLHDYLWSIVLGAANGQPLSLALQERVRRAGELLYQLQDDESGEVPLYGSSDGALILPLSNGGYRDFRPVVQSTAFLTRGERRLPPGPWDEESLWLWGPSVLEAAGHLPSGVTDQPSLTPTMPSSAPPSRACHGEAERSRAEPRGRVAEGREGGTQEAIARPSITPYPPTCPLTPSPACAAAGEGARRPGGGHYIISQPHPQQPATPAFSPLPSGRGAGGEGAGGGHLPPSVTDQPLPTPPLPSSLPSPACAAAGEGGRRPGGGHLPSDAPCPPSADPAVPAESLPSPACAAAGEGGRRPGGGHLCSAATEHSTEPSPPPQPTVASTPRTDLHAATRGYYTLRTDAGFAFMRCGDHAPGHRPGQQDQLHVDIWWRGQNIAVDGGTYSYNPPEPWGHDFALAAMHNTVDVDGRGQSDRVSGFLSLPWAKGRLVANLRSSHGGLAYLEGELDAYLRLADPVRYRRAVVRVGEEHWLVLDRLIGTDEHTYRLHWLLGDWPYEWLPDEGRVLLHTPSGPYQVRLGCLSATPELQLVRAEEESAQGWHAPHYLDRWAALSLSATVEASGCTFWSLLGPPEACVSAAGSGLEFTVGQRTVTAVLHQAADAPIVRTLRGRPPRPTTRGNGAP